MPRSDLLDGAYSKINRARIHAAEVQGLDLSFAKDKSYRIILDNDSEPGWTHHRIYGIPSVSEDFSLAAGDAVHNARSALDHLAVALVRLNKPNWSADDVRLGQIQFPIHNKPVRLKDLINSNRIQPAGKAAIKAVCDLKPYKGGNDLIYALRRLDDADKHRNLVTTAACLAKGKTVLFIRYPFDEPAHSPTDGPVAYAMGLHGGPIEEGSIVASHATHMKCQYKFTLTVTFKEPGILETESVVASVNKLINCAKTIVESFDARFFS